MIGRYKPSSARSPDNTSVASGIPKGSNDPEFSVSRYQLGAMLVSV
jgi:hypothetical protein